MKFDIYNIINIILAVVLVYVTIRPVIIKTGLTHKNRHVGQAIDICDALAQGIITNYSNITSLTGSQKKKEAANDLMERIKKEPGINISAETAMERIQVAVNAKKRKDSLQK